MAFPCCSLMKGHWFEAANPAAARQGSTKQDEAGAAESLLLQLLKTQWAFLIVNWV